MPRHTGSFLATDESDQEYTVYVFPAATTGEASPLELPNGQKVTRVGPGEYRIDQNGVALRSNHPDAP